MYWFYKPVTKKTIQSQDVVWLNKPYGEYVHQTLEKSNSSLSEYEDEEEEEEVEPLKTEQVEAMKVNDVRLRRALKHMSTSYNPLLLKGKRTSECST